MTTMMSGMRHLWADSNATFAALLADPAACVEYQQVGVAWDAIAGHDTGNDEEAAQDEPTEGLDRSRAGRW
jgi:hypothetical protein